MTWQVANTAIPMKIEQMAVTIPAVARRRRALASLALARAMEAKESHHAQGDPQHLRHAEAGQQGHQHGDDADE